MNKVFNIKYIDACYIFTKKISQTKLFLHEAYGYVKKNGNNIIIVFIKRKLDHGQEKVALGLVIPDTALVSKKDIFDKNILTNLKIGMSIAVTWRDIVVFDYDDSRNDCSIMYTEGILFKIEKDHIVLKNPETVRVYPSPIRNHPLKKPDYYIVPTSLITDIKIVK